MPSLKKKQHKQFTPAPKAAAAKRRKTHWAVRFTGFKLYDEDADMANFVAENASITNLCAAAIRIQYHALKRFFSKTLPDHLDHYPINNDMSERNEVLIDVDPEVHDQFIEANKEIEKALGKAPGAAFLIGMAAEKVDPQEIAREYLDGVSRYFGKQARN